MLSKSQGVLDVGFQIGFLVEQRYGKHVLNGNTGVAALNKSQACVFS